MVEKLNNIFFHPSKLGRYKNTKFYKVFLYFIFLSIFSITVSIIDIIIDPRLTIADREKVELISDFDFNIARDLPNCSLVDNVYSCEDEDSNIKELATIFGMITIVSDVNNELSKINTIKFTRDFVVINIGMSSEINIRYDKLPNKWQEFDFKEIKNSDYPDIELFRLFIGGYNEVIHYFVPFIIIGNIIGTIIIKVIEVLFYSLIFYLLYRRFYLKYSQILKITIFAQSLPITILVIASLLGINLYLSFFTTLLTFIYVYIAIINCIPRNQEF